MNLVSREKAIDVAIDEYNRGYKEGFEAASLKWVPCSERLPEKEGNYIVAFDKSCLREGDFTISDAIWRNNQWQYGFFDKAHYSCLPIFTVEPIEEAIVIAWMPLPEPYKGE